MEVQRNVTLEDVAAHAGVSRSTVSLVLRNSALVAENTRKKVMISVHKLGYIPDRRAASLRSRRSHMFGMVVPNVLNPVYAGMINGVEQEFGNSNTLLALCNSKDDVTRQSEALTTLMSHGVDGVILVPAVDTTAAMLRERLNLIANRCVLLGRDIPGSNLDYAGTDNILGAELATSHLLGNGHRRIAFIGGQDKSSTRRERAAGFRKAHERLSVLFDEGLVINCSVTLKGGFDAVIELLRRRSDVTAVVTYNSDVAVGVLSGLMRLRITPGLRFGFVSFDHVEQAELWDPPLTTVGVEPSDLGIRAARLLTHRSADPGGPRERVVLLPELRIRKS